MHHQFPPVGRSPRTAPDALVRLLNLGFRKSFTRLDQGVETRARAPTLLRTLVNPKHWLSNGDIADDLLHGWIGVQSAPERNVFGLAER